MCIVGEIFHRRLRLGPRAATTASLLWKRICIALKFYPWFVPIRAGPPACVKMQWFDWRYVSNAVDFLIRVCEISNNWWFGQSFEVISSLVLSQSFHQAKKKVASNPLGIPLISINTNIGMDIIDT